jgi:hypothetical protein
MQASPEMTGEPGRSLLRICCVKAGLGIFPRNRVGHALVGVL